MVQSTEVKDCGSFSCVEPQLGYNTIASLNYCFKHLGIHVIDHIAKLFVTIHFPYILSGDTVNTKYP